MSTDEIKSKKKKALLIIHQILMSLFLFFSMISLWNNIYELVLVNAILGVVVYIESAQFLSDEYFDKWKVNF